MARSGGVAPSTSRCPARSAPRWASRTQGSSAAAKVVTGSRLSPASTTSVALRSSATMPPWSAATRLRVFQVWVGERPRLWPV